MATTGPTQRRAHRPSRRAALLQAGLDEFIAEGYAAATMSSIAERSGMSTSSLYYHFASKDELLLALVEEIGASMREAIVQTVADLGPGLLVSPPARKVLDGYLDWQMTHPREAELLFVTIVGADAAVEDKRRHFELELVQFIADSVIAPMHPETDALEQFAAAAAVQVLFAHIARTETLDREAAATVLERIIDLASHH